MEVLFSQPKQIFHAKQEKGKERHNTDQWILSPVLGQSKSDGTNFLGARKDPTLGHLSSLKKGESGQAIVHRSWGLLDRGSGDVYGARFCFNEFVESNSSSRGLKRRLLGQCCYTPMSERLTS